MTFSYAFQISKLKARTSLFNETWQKRPSTFELWTFENVTPSGIDCTSNQQSYVRGPLRECRSIRSGASGLPYYCAPVWVSAVIDSLPVCVCVVLFCFIKPIMGNHYVRSRGFHCEWAKGEHPRSEIADVPTSPCPPLEPGVSGSSPSTLTTSLTTPIPSSSSLNRPTTTMLTTRGLCPGGSGGWASPKFVRLLWWRYWVMVGFLEIQGPNCQWNPPLSTTKSNTCLFKNKKKPEGEGTPVPERSRTH